MELAENGSVAELIARAGARTLAEIAPQIDGDGHPAVQSGRSTFYCPQCQKRS